MQQRNLFETDLRVVLAGAIADALETMAFITPEPALSTPEDFSGGGVRRVQVGFSGHGVEGHLELLTSCQLGANLAASISGDDGGPLDPADEPSVARAEDALQELANVTCGTVLRQLAAGPGAARPRFALTVPAIDAPSGEARAGVARDFLDHSDTAALLADGQPLAARLTVAAQRLAEAAT